MPIVGKWVIIKSLLEVLIEKITGELVDFS